MNEQNVFDENGNKSFEVETGEYTKRGYVETICFELVQYGKINENNNIIQEPLIRYTGIH